MDKNNYNEEMMEFNLINPSDPYTFLAEDLETAALLVFSLSTMYGAKTEDGSASVPVCMFIDPKEWYMEQFGRTPDEGLIAKRDALIAALDSLMLGSFQDRKRYSAALNAITDPEKRTEFMSVWQDSHSSLNDIGTFAHTLAKKFAEKAEEL